MNLRNILDIKPSPTLGLPYLCFAAIFSRVVQLVGRKCFSNASMLVHPRPFRKKNPNNRKRTKMNAVRTVHWKKQSRGQLTHQPRPNRWSLFSHMLSVRPSQKWKHSENKIRATKNTMRENNDHPLAAACWVTLYTFWHTNPSALGGH